LDDRIESDWIASGLAVWFDESSSKDPPKTSGERRQGTSILVHIDENAITRPKPCIPPSSRGNTQFIFVFLIISDKRALLLPRPPADPPVLALTFFLRLDVAVEP